MTKTAKKPVSRQSTRIRKTQVAPTDLSPAQAKAADNTPAKTSTPTPQAANKQARVVELLTRPEGATLENLIEATGWQKHSVRGLISGALKKRLGLSVTSVASDKGRVYRIVEASALEGHA